MSWIYGQQWGLLGFEHERIECKNKVHIKPKKDGGGSKQKNVVKKID